MQEESAYKALTAHESPEHRPDASSLDQRPSERSLQGEARRTQSDAAGLVGADPAVKAVLSDAALGGHGARPPRLTP